MKREAISNRLLRSRSFPMEGDFVSDAARRFVSREGEAGLSGKTLSTTKVASIGRDHSNQDPRTQRHFSSFDEVAKEGKGVFAKSPGGMLGTVLDLVTQNLPNLPGSNIAIREMFGNGSLPLT